MRECEGVVLGPTSGNPNNTSLWLILGWCCASPKALAELIDPHQGTGSCHSQGGTLTDTAAPQSQRSVAGRRERLSPPQQVAVFGGGGGVGGKGSRRPACYVYSSKEA